PLGGAWCTGREMAIEIDWRADLAGPFHRVAGRAWTNPSMPWSAARCFGLLFPSNGAGRADGEPQLILPCYDGIATLHLDLAESEQAEHYMRKAQETRERAGSTRMR